MCPSVPQGQPKQTGKFTVLPRLDIHSKLCHGTSIGDRRHCCPSGRAGIKSAAGGAHVPGLRKAGTQNATGGVCVPGVNRALQIALRHSCKGLDVHAEGGR